MIAVRSLGIAWLVAIFGCGAAPPAPEAAKAAAPKATSTQATATKAAQAVPLRNAGFENAPRAGERCPESWGCTMHSDPDSFVFRVDAVKPGEGKQALCIERVRNEPWALATQILHDTSKLRGTKARFSVSVRVDRTDGAGLGPWILVHGPAGNLAHEEKLVTKTTGWERIAVEFRIDPTAQMLQVGATMQGGGRACIDDARLEILDPP